MWFWASFFFEKKVFFLEQNVPFSIDSSVEPHISRFANFTPCEELVPKRHFWKMWYLRMINFDNFGGLTSVLKFHIFLIFNCEELVRIRAICVGLVRFFSDVIKWYSIFTNVKNRYQFFTPVLWPGMIIFKCQSLAPTWHDRFGHFTFYV